MPSRDELLRTATYKDEVDTISQRVFYTLRDGDTRAQHGTSHRTALLLAHLVDHLRESGKISDDEIDDMLMKSIG